MIIAGVDIGNSTTEVCLGKLNSTGKMEFIADAQTDTTGLKGTIANLVGIETCLKRALFQVGLKIEDLDLIRINEAAPVIGDTAMETITETIISGSSMIGHNPDTPAGEGVAVGKTVLIENLPKVKGKDPILVVVDHTYDYEKVAIILNTSKVNVVGVLLQKDEAVLVYNRLNQKVPIVDEIDRIDLVPQNAMAAIEVASLGGKVLTLSNPYGLAKLFSLSPEETRRVIPITKSLVGKKSAVFIRNLEGGVQERTIKAGTLAFIGADRSSIQIDVDEGAQVIMQHLKDFGELEDVMAQEGTRIDEMFRRMKSNLSELTATGKQTVQIRDMLAIDTMVPMKVSGSLAKEVAMEKAVAVAAMVKADQLPMKVLANRMQEEFTVPVEVAGVEAVMAMVGALTTRGIQLPLAILDLGGGSTDAALLQEDGRITSVHLAGAGAFITMMINEELALDNPIVSEWIKCYPLAKVNSLYQITMENGEVRFFKEPLEAKLYARTILVKDQEFVPILTDHSMEKIIEVRKEVKQKVFIMNALRALEKVAPNNKIRKIPNVVLVGGSALDREIPDMIQEELAKYNIVSGRADIRGCAGPRNAVATGLVISYLPEVGYE